MSRIMQINLRDEIQKLKPSRTLDMSIAAIKLNRSEVQELMEREHQPRLRASKNLRVNCNEKKSDMAVGVRHTRTISSCELKRPITKNSKRIEQKQEEWRQPRISKPRSTKRLPVSIPFVKEVIREADNLPFDIILKSRNSLNEDSEDFIMMDEPHEIGLQGTKQLGSTAENCCLRRESSLECTFKPTALKEQLSEALKSSANDKMRIISNGRREQKSNRSLSRSQKSAVSAKDNKPPTTEPINRNQVLVQKYKGKLQAIRQGVQAVRKQSIRQFQQEERASRTKTPSSNSSLRKDCHRTQVAPSGQKQNRYERMTATTKPSKGLISNQPRHNRSQRMSDRAEPLQEREYQRVINQLHRKIQRMQL